MVARHDGRLDSAGLAEDSLPLPALCLDRRNTPSLNSEPDCIKVVDTFRIGEAMTRSLALLERLRVKGEAEEKVDRWMGGPL